MNTDRHFKSILAPMKDFLAITLEICGSSGMQRGRDHKDETHSLIEQRAKNSSSWQKLLPRTFIFVKADYKFSSVQIYI